MRLSPLDAIPALCAAGLGMLGILLFGKWGVVFLMPIGFFLGALIVWGIRGGTKLANDMSAERRLEAAVEPLLAQQTLEKQQTAEGQGTPGSAGTQPQAPPAGTQPPPAGTQPPPEVRPPAATRPAATPGASEEARLAAAVGPLLAGGAAGGAPADGTRSAPFIARPVEETDSAGVVPTAPAIDLPTRLQEITARGETDPAGALQAARALLETHGTSPGVHALVAELSLVAGDTAAALASANEALRLDLHSGTGARAAGLFRRFGLIRDRLEIPPEGLVRLGRILTRQSEWRDAAWCLGEAEKAGVDPVAVAKDLIAVADGARGAGDLKVAFGIYRYVLEQHPDLPFTDYVAEQVRVLERKLTG